MFCFLLLASTPVLLYIFLGLFIVLFSLQILNLILFEKQKKRFKKRINKALSYQVDVDQERIKLYCKNSNLDIIDEKEKLFSIPNEENAKFILQGISPRNTLTTKAIRVEIKFIKRDDSFDGPFKVYFSPSNSFVDIWTLKKFTSENEAVFEHPIMGELKLKKFPQSLKIGDIVKIQQKASNYYQSTLVQYKILT